MNDRFFYQKKTRSKKLLLSVCLFLVILILFYKGISSISEASVARQRESLERALKRDIAYCYTLEGSYPQSLAYLKEHYGLIYDSDLFYVDYQVTGSNIYPDYTIIERSGSHARK